MKEFRATERCSRCFFKGTDGGGRGGDGGGSSRWKVPSVSLFGCCTGEQTTG